MVAQDPIIVVTGGSAKIRLGEQNFHGSPKRDYDDPNAQIIRVVVKDSAENVIDSFDFPDGKFKVEFYGKKNNNSTNTTTTTTP
jgi:hypothetical protein